MLAAVFTALSAGLLAPSLYMSDDVSMAAFVDGSYTGEPVPHMVYTNVAVGLVLHSLYGAAGSVPWYGIYLFAAHFVALTVILYVVLADRRPGRGWRLLAVAAWLAVFGLWMGTQITFTQVSMLLGSAGVLLYLSRATLAQVHWAVVVAAGAVLGAAFLIRAQSLWAVLVLSLPLLLLAVRRVPWRRQVLFAATAAAVLLFGWAVQTVYYADRPDWQEYSAFNAARGRLEWAVEQGVVDEGDARPRPDGARTTWPCSASGPTPTRTSTPPRASNRSPTRPRTPCSHRSTRGRASTGCAGGGGLTRPLSSSVSP